MGLSSRTRPALFDPLIALFEGPRGLLLAMLLLPLLLGLVLWLPPLSLLERIEGQGYVSVGWQGDRFSDPDGTVLRIPRDALRGPTRLRFVSAPRRAFIEGAAGGVLEGAPAALPAHLVIKSPVYVAGVRGPTPRYSRWQIPIPNESEPHHLLDLYRWDGTRWSWLPRTLNGETEQVEAVTPGVPTALALMQAQRLPPEVRAESGENNEWARRSGAALTMLSPRLYLIQPDGRIGQLYGEPVPLQGALLVPVLHNVEPAGTVRGDLVNNLLLDPNAWRSHVDQIAALVADRQYDGIAIDYREVAAEMEGEFSKFVSLLGERLAASGQVLIVRVAPPQPLEHGGYSTGAYDWQRIGRAATQLQLPIPRDEAGRVAEPAAIRSLLEWATGRVDRYKIELELPATAYRSGETGVQPVAHSTVLEALSRAAGLELATLTAFDDPFEQVRLGLEAGGQLRQENNGGLYRLETGSEPIFIVRPEALRARLALLDDFHLGGIMIPDPALVDPALWEVVAGYRAVGVAR